MSTRSNYLWATIDKVGGIALAFLFNLVMARWFLSPREFGIIGMLQIFISLAYTTVIAGFGQALIQTKDLKRADINTVFTTNLLLAVIVYAILYIAAPAIAVFYGEPILKDVLRALGLQLIICSFFIVQYNIALRESQLRRLCLITLISSTLGYTVGVILAKSGAGVWSLVVATLALYLFQTIGLWSTTKAYPALGINKASFKKLVPYSGFIYLATIIDQAYIHGLSMILGKRFSATTLGYYTQANKLQMVPSQAIQEVGYQVLFPDFSRYQSSPDILKERYRKNLRLLTILSVLGFSILFLTAEPLVLLLFTDKWLPSVPMLRILTPVGLFLVLSFIPTLLIRSVGKAKSYFILVTIERVIGIVTLIILSGIGMYETLWGLVGLNVAYFLFNIYYVSRLAPITIKEQLSDVFPILLLQGAVIIATNYLLNFIAFSNLIVEILIGLVIPSCSVLSFCNLLGLTSTSELRALLRRRK
ncbi:lipopolysaccharide biosynthesis protein [uncultured Porphyromonas sp.]|uniref:lipopolysaccharide biosynthesis protein n=1 Tax=uncultured Porphyromonas sp. TaxID=159274 RepID=UPI0026279C16|nr:lipopolysaccharide biosynthesis protein [uncultured Porphyromonas sp.]